MCNPCIIQRLHYSYYTCKTNEFKQSSINYKRRSCGDVKMSKGRRRDVATRRPNETCRRRKLYEQNDVLRTSANYVGTTKLDT